MASDAYVLVNFLNGDLSLIREVQAGSRRAGQ